MQKCSASQNSPWGCRPKCLSGQFGLQRNYSTHVQPGGSLATPVLLTNCSIATTLRPKMGQKMAIAVAATAAAHQPRQPESHLRSQTFTIAKWESGCSHESGGCRGLSVIGTSARKRPAEVFGIYGASCRAACKQHSLTVGRARRTCLYPEILP